MKAKTKAQKGSGSAVTLTAFPSYADDWQIYDATESDAELEARFYYEFARESQTALRVVKSLCHFTPAEIMRGQRGHLWKPVCQLDALHPSLDPLAMALLPDFDLERVSWHALAKDKKESAIRVFAPLEEAFRPLDELELADFHTGAFRRQDSRRSDRAPRWLGSSRFHGHGVEEAAFRIDWSAGPQAVQAAMKRWFVNRKHEIREFARDGRLPGKPSMVRHYFAAKDKEGAKHPRQKQARALRGLAAMRLLSNRTLKEAIELTKRVTRETTYAGSIDPNTHKPKGRSAWNRGIEAARQTFRDLFFAPDELSVEWRRIEGLPESEEPISYRQYLARK